MFLMKLIGTFTRIYFLLHKSSTHLRIKMGMQTNFCIPTLKFNTIQTNSKLFRSDNDSTRLMY